MIADADHAADLSAEGRDMLRLLLECQRPPSDFGRAHSLDDDETAALISAAASLGDDLT